jgi:cyclopropane-fatty-acyl-phospholipid synthase
VRITAVDQNKSGAKSLFNMTELSRKAVYAILERLTVGSLVLEENGQTRHFGDRQDKTVTASIQVKDPAAFMAVLKDGSTGAGEAYMLGQWDTPDLLEVIRLFVLNMHTLQEMGNKQPLWRKLASKMHHAFRANSLTGSKRNISAHYDLSNEFFSLFLDPTMAYSSGIFKNESDTLHDASLNKFQHICERLQLQPEDHLLEIGTGWGGLAIHAAKHFGCRVTTTTISHEQYMHACDWVKQEGLEEKITLLEKDYRELDGSAQQYDKLVSVEMIEAVGAKYYDEYFQTCSSLVKPHGLMLIQAITISDQRFEQSVNSIDFIKRYIFPGGQLPSNAVIADKIATHTDLQLIGLEDITHDYAKTLAAWRERFWDRIDDVRRLGTDDIFIRMWNYYLCFCEGGFRERVIHTGQFLMAKPGFRELPRIR